jgi:streptogramin lyase
MHSLRRSVSDRTIRWLVFVCVAGFALSASAAARISTFAGTGKTGYSGDNGQAIEAQLNNPYGIARGPDGALYICDMENQRIRRVGKGGIMTTVAGTGRRGYSGDGGPALEADLNEPYEVRFDKSGNMFFVEMRNAVVRRVDMKTHIASTVAGMGQEGFSGEGGPATKAQLRQPHSIQFDPQGDLYICDIGNNRIRKVEMKTGIISTFAGTGEKGITTDGAKFANAPLNGPRAIDFDQDGNAWLALREGNAIYKLELKAGTIHHIAGTGKSGFTGNGGPAKEATLSGPKGISVAPVGSVYFTDTESHSVRRINLLKGTVELVAGTGERGDGPNGDPLNCKLSRPHGIFVDSDGGIFIGDSENHRVRVIR